MILRLNPSVPVLLQWLEELTQKTSEVMTIACDDNGSSTATENILNICRPWRDAAAITRTGQITVVLVILSIFGIMVCCLSVTCWTYRCIVRCCFSYCLSPCSGDVTLLIYWICIHYCWIVYVWFKLWDFDLYVDYLLRRGCQLEMFTIIDTVHA